MITRRSFMKGAACGSLGFVAGLNKLGAAAADKDYKLGTSDPAKIWVERLGWDKEILLAA
jgi:hypothetical protein